MNIEVVPLGLTGLRANAASKHGGRNYSDTKIKLSCLDPKGRTACRPLVSDPVCLVRDIRHKQQQYQQNKGNGNTGNSTTATNTNHPDGDFARAVHSSKAFRTDPSLSQTMMAAHFVPNVVMVNHHNDNAKRTTNNTNDTTPKAKPPLVLRPSDDAADSQCRYQLYADVVHNHSLISLCEVDLSSVIQDIRQTQTQHKKRSQKQHKSKQSRTQQTLQGEWQTLSLRVTLSADIDHNSTSTSKSSPLILDPEHSYLWLQIRLQPEGCEDYTDDTNNNKQQEEMLVRSGVEKNTTSLSSEAIHKSSSPSTSLWASLLEKMSGGVCQAGGQAHTLLVDDDDDANNAHHDNIILPLPNNVESLKDDDEHKWAFTTISATKQSQLGKHNVVKHAIGFEHGANDNYSMADGAGAGELETVYTRRRPVDMDHMQMMGMQTVTNMSHTPAQAPQPMSSGFEVALSALSSTHNKVGKVSPLRKSNKPGKTKSSSHKYDVVEVMDDAHHGCDGDVVTAYTMHDQEEERARQFMSHIRELQRSDKQQKELEIIERLQKLQLEMEAAGAHDGSGKGGQYYHDEDATQIATAIQIKQALLRAAQQHQELMQHEEMQQTIQQQEEASAPAAQGQEDEDKKRAAFKLKLQKSQTLTIQEEKLALQKAARDIERQRLADEERLAKAAAEEELERGGAARKKSPPSKNSSKNGKSSSSSSKSSHNKMTNSKSRSRRSVVNEEDEEEYCSDRDRDDGYDHSRGRGHNDNDRYSSTRKSRKSSSHRDSNKSKKKISGSGSGKSNSPTSVMDNIPHTQDDDDLSQNGSRRSADSHSHSNNYNDDVNTFRTTSSDSVSQCHYIVTNDHHDDDRSMAWTAVTDRSDGDAMTLATQLTHMALEEETDYETLKRIMAGGLWGVVLFEDVSHLPSSKVMQKLDRLTVEADRRHYSSKHGNHRFLLTNHDDLGTTKEETFVGHALAEDFGLVAKQAPQTQMDLMARRMQAQVDKENQKMSQETALKAAALVEAKRLVLVEQQEEKDKKQQRQQQQEQEEERRKQQKQKKKNGKHKGNVNNNTTTKKGKQSSSGSSKKDGCSSSRRRATSVDVDQAEEYNYDESSRGDEKGALDDHLDRNNGSSKGRNRQRSTSPTTTQSRASGTSSRRSGATSRSRKSTQSQSSRSKQQHGKTKSRSRSRVPVAGAQDRDNEDQDQTKQLTLASSQSVAGEPSKKVSFAVTDEVYVVEKCIPPPPPAKAKSKSNSAGRGLVMTTSLLSANGEGKSTSGKTITITSSNNKGTPKRKGLFGRKSKQQAAVEC
jgi:hypothetical protein